MPGHTRRPAARAIAMAALLAIAACITAGHSATPRLAAAPAPATELPPLIPREVLFGNPERINPQLSPDGRYLTYRAPDARGIIQIWLRTIGAEDDHPITTDQRRGIPSYFWAYDGAHIVYLQDAGGDENFRLYAVNIESGDVRDLTPFERVQARLVARHPSFPDELLVGLNRQDPRRHDVYRLNIQTGELTLDTENPGNVTGWVVDQRFQVRAANAVTREGGQEVLVRDAPGEPFRTLRRWQPGDAGFASYFPRDGNTLVLIADHDANALRLVSVDLATGAETVLAEDPAYDIFSFIVAPGTSRLQLVSYFRDRIRWDALDPETAADVAAIEAIGGTPSWNWLGRDLADTTWLVAFIVDDGPVRYYAYDRRGRTGTFLFSDRPRLEGYTLAPMEPIAFQARDGLTIHGYLTLPVGVPAERLPAVLLVHGGPWARDLWGLHNEAQWLANRGYAVLQVNFRGSTGYGKAFLNAGDGEWAGKMHDDLIDGVSWLVGRGIADPAQVGIAGGSYGGYAVLVGLAFTPGVFAAGVDLFGISDLVTLLRNRPAEWGPGLPLQDRRIGANPDTDPEYLRARSPIHAVDRIVAPLLIAQGENDRRVPQAQSDGMVAALRAAEKEVEYWVYAEEGHGFARPANRLHFYALAEAFLARHLGGRAAPAGPVPGHTGTQR